LISDHGYWTWLVPLIGEYTQVRKEIAMKEPLWENKVPPVVLRGVVELNEIRRDLLKVAEGTRWNNVRGMNWASPGGAEGATEDSKNISLKIADRCYFQYLIYTEGT
jgi:hypothetical protein